MTSCKRFAIAALLPAMALPLDTAAASQLSFDGRLVYTASQGERNLAEFYILDDDFGPVQLRVYDAVPIQLTPATSAAGCARESANVILCDPHPVVASLGDMDDEGTGSQGPDAIDGGPGNDALWGGPGDDVISGGPGDDQLEAEHNLGAGQRDETLGADTLSGGPGTDALGYQSRLDALTITLDGQANDGAPGEGDNVASDIERVAGGNGADTLIGDDAANVLDGFAGPDLVVGGAGNDVLDGDAGNDEVRGDAGDDSVSGSSGSDVLDGGPGADQFYGDPSNCTVFACSGGDDELRARDGEADTVRCGVGLDRAIVDARDVVLDDLREHCESIDPPPVPPQPTPQPGPPAPTMTITRAPRLAAFLRGITVSVACPAACAIDADLFVDRKTARRYRIGRRRTQIATAHGELGSAGTARLRLAPRVKRAAKRRLVRARRLSADLVVVAQTDGGATWRRQVRLEVRR